VLIYPAFVLAQAPRAFFINIFRIHMLNSEWLRQLGIVHDKFRLTFTYLTLPGYLVLFIIAAYLILALVLLGRKDKTRSGRSALLAAFLAAAFLAIALSLPTIWRQYLAPPVPFLILSFAYPLAFLRERSGPKVSKVPFTVGAGLMGLGVLMAVLTGPSITDRISACFAPKTWAPMKVHRIATNIAEKTKEPKLILTTAPLFALEGGCEIYTEFSAGAFAYRIGDLMSEEDRHITRTAGPHMLKELVRQSPPSAIIVGVEPPYFSHLEEPLESLAEADWHKEVYENGLRVFFRP
jgi:hypothetical protein